MNISMDNKYTLFDKPFTVLTVTKPGPYSVAGYFADGSLRAFRADGTSGYRTDNLVEVSQYPDFLVDKKVMQQALNSIYPPSATAQSVKPNTDKLLQIIAATYQIAGACDMPVYILDVLANPERATQEQIDAMLPFVRPASEQNFCPRCGKRLGGIDDIHTCTPVVQS